MADWAQLEAQDGVRLSWCVLASLPRASHTRSTRAWAATRLAATSAVQATHGGRQWLVACTPWALGCLLCPPGFASHLRLRQERVAQHPG